MLGLLLARRTVSSRARRSSEWRAPAAGRALRTQRHFRQFAAYPRSSSIACVMSPAPRPGLWPRR
eukprot:15480726-Alexandrium_andersonii.AAC.1